MPREGGWIDVDRAVVAEIRQSLPEVFAADPPAVPLAAAAQRIRRQLAEASRPYDWIAGACGWGPQNAPDDDAELWLRAAASVFAPAGDPGWPAVEQSRVFVIRHQDWLFAVRGVVSAGVGADASAEALAAYAATGADGDRAVLRDGFFLILPLWRALGAVDGEDRLTPLGWWGLPWAFAAAWNDPAPEHLPQPDHPASAPGDQTHQVRERRDDERPPEDREPEETVSRRSGVARTTAVERGAAVAAYEQWRRDLSPLSSETAARVAEELAEPHPVKRVASEFQDPAERDSWERFLTKLYRVASDVTSRGAAAVAMLLAQAAEWREDTTAEKTWLERALDHDADHVDALSRLADYAADAGDAAQAVELLSRAGQRRDDSRMATYRQFAAPPRTSTPRNAPCPCGSGKKYKACCLGRAAHPLRERASLLVFKLLTFLHRPPQVPDLRQWGARAAGVGDPDSPAALMALRGSATFDTALWEGGLFDRFLTVRGPLLPADERELARTWRQTRRGRYEVGALRVGFAATLHDLADGHTHKVRDRAVTDTLRPKDVVIARLLPVENEYRMGMVLRVPPAEHQVVAANPAILTDPDALLTWVREASARARGRGGDSRHKHTTR